MKKYILIMASALSVQLAAAQSGNIERQYARGALMNRDLMTIADLGNMTQSQPLFGTARATALGGAMSSLGGDASSIISNPAGLGMYRNEEFSISPSLSFNKSESSSAGADGRSYGSNKREPFTLGNLAYVYNISESINAPLVSLNAAVAYTRTADFNQNYTLSKTGMSSSIANLFSRQLAGAGVLQDNIRYDEATDYDRLVWNNYGTNIWGALLGYKAYLTEQTNVGATPPTWSATWITPEAQQNVSQQYSLQSEGGIGEYSFSMGGNIENKLYFGLSLALLDLRRDLEIIYEEQYPTNELNAGGYALHSSYYSQRIIEDGIGFNIKMGLTYRPTDDLRIGFAYHTPDWYSVERSYQASVGSVSTQQNEGYNRYAYAADSPLLEDYGEYSWNFRSGSKLILGGSWIHENRLLLTADLEREFFSGATISKAPAGLSSAMYDESSSIFDNITALRVGAEYKLSPVFALRVGAGQTSSSIAGGVTSVDLLDVPMLTKQEYYTAGFGFSPSRGVSIDFAYMTSKNTYSSYYLFKADGVLDAGSPSVASSSSNIVNSTLNDSRFMLSLVLRM